MWCILLFSRTGSLSQLRCDVHCPCRILLRAIGWFVTDMFIHCRLPVAFARPTDDIIIVANSLIMRASTFIIACVIIFQGRQLIWQPGVLFISTWRCQKPHFVVLSKTGCFGQTPLSMLEDLFKLKDPFFSEGHKSRAVAFDMMWLRYLMLFTELLKHSWWICGNDRSNGGTATS